MKVFLAGSYHGNNKGDELIFYSVFDRLKLLVGKSLSLTVLSADPLYFSSHYNIDSVSPYNVFKLVKSIRECDMVIIGGGGLFFDYSLIDTLRLNGESQLLYWGFISNLAAFFNKKVLWYSVGIGPIKTSLGKFILKQSANKVTKISVRDSDSYKLLRNLASKDKVVESRDCVFGQDLLNFPMVVGSNFKDKDYVLLIPRYWKGKDHLIKNRFSSIIADLIRRNKKIVLTSTNDSKDHRICNSILQEFKDYKKIKYVRITKDKPLSLLISIIKSSSFIISMRMHPIIIGAVIDKPSIGIDYLTPKVKDCMQELGLGRLCFSLENSSKEILEGIDYLENNFQKSKNIIFRNMTIIKGLENENKKLLLQ